MKIEDYLPFYLGCEVEIQCFEKKISILIGCRNFGNYQTAHTHYQQNMWSAEEIKPILRKLSSMTEDEFDEFKTITDNDFSKMVVIEAASHDGCFTRLAHKLNSSAYLLSKHFDLFGLIDAGLALDKAEVAQLI